MKHHALITVVISLFSTAAFAVELNTPERMNDIHQNVQQNLPFDLGQTQQAFTKTVHGGIQHMVAKSADNPQLIKAIQAYMLKLASQFRKGDFSDTERIHGAAMPGLAELKKATLNDIKFEYKALEKGAQIHYATENSHLLENLHAWFDAQIKDHGNAVISEHAQHHLTPAE
jgi:hypothetical protein